MFKRIPTLSLEKNSKQKCYIVNITRTLVNQQRQFPHLISRLAIIGIGMRTKTTTTIKWHKLRIFERQTGRDERKEDISVFFTKTKERLGKQSIRIIRTFEDWRFKRTKKQQHFLFAKQLSGCIGSLLSFFNSLLHLLRYLVDIFRSIYST